MKNVKKLLAVLLALVMVLSLFAGCDNKSTKKKNNDDDDDDDVKGTITTSATETTGSTEITPTDNTDQAQKEFDIGSVKTNTYTNAFAGIQLTLGSDWTFKTDAEIEEMNKSVWGYMGDDYKDMAEDASSFTDMMVVHANGTDSINVVFQKIPDEYMHFTEKEYLELSADAVKGGLEAMGYTSLATSMGRMQIGGQEHACMAVRAYINGIPFYECMAIIKCENYMICITAASFQVDLTQEMLGAFQPI